MAEETGSSGQVDIKIEIKEEPVFVEASIAESEDLVHTDDPLKEEIKDEEEVDVDLLKDEIIVGEPSCSSEEASRSQFDGSSCFDAAAFFVSTSLRNEQGETPSGRGNSNNSATNVNIPENGHKCSICDKLFSQSIYLRRHIVTHNGLREHQCEVCGKCFASPYYLSDHMFTHTGIRPYTCETCGKSFSYQSSLKTHCLIHKGVKNHKCTICSKYFGQRQALKKHMVTHDPGNPKRRVKCEICGKGFMKEETLKIHLMIHNGEKPYKCDICGRGYTQKGMLKRHFLWAHYEDKPLKCNMCGEESAETSTSDSHVVLVHKTKN